MTRNEGWRAGGDREPVDYLIVGGGSAGCVLAARLSEDARIRVTLVEAGRDVTGATMDPAISSRYPGRAYLDSRNIWPDLRVRVAATATSDDERLYEQGHLLGGGSAINALMANRGAPDDYDEWGALGADGWSWEACLPYFRKLESDRDFKGVLHGEAGPVPIRRLQADEVSPFAKAAYAAFRSAGHAMHDDQNGIWRDGVFLSAMALGDDGRRIPMSLAYLTPDVRRRPNLEVVTGHLVERIELDGLRAVGAVIAPHDGGSSCSIRAREVIVSAGAIHTPALLMRSGIGPGDLLSGLGIDVALDRRGVGGNLMEHPMTAVSAYLPKASREANLSEHSDHGTLRFSSGLDGTPQGDMHVAIIARSGWHSVGRRIGSLLTWVNKPFSRGTLSLSSANARDEPRVDFRLLSDERDMERLKIGFHVAASALRSTDMRDVALAPFQSGYSPRVAKLAGSGAFDVAQRGVFSTMLDAAGPLRPALIRATVTSGRSLDRVLSDDGALEDHLLASVSGVWHASGTCRMGASDDPGAVTDGEGRIRGVGGLRICDASLMPSIPRANINTPVVMMAERIADLVRGGRSTIYNQEHRT